MNTETQVELTIEDVQWATEIARSSFARWASQPGYYNNRLGSHFKGKLGELAVEKFLLDQKLQLDSHFRFSDRENLSDIVVKINRYKTIARLEVKTWSSNYWRDLGRCVAVEQYPDLKKKADIIIWCLVNVVDIKKVLENPMPLKVTLAGWSKIGEVAKAPIRLTGLDGMRKVENYQLAGTDLHPMGEILSNIL
ncbi:MAG: hypothetical protein MUO77_06385 [Anaerolineales bacterium]|nr:hypothetical protein [Anaerolineales bacterium]